VRERGLARGGRRFHFERAIAVNQQ
jgi:hypothetical protein